MVCIQNLRDKEDWGVKNMSMTRVLNHRKVYKNKDAKKNKEMDKL